MLSIQDLIDQFTIQGGYEVKCWDEDIQDTVTFAQGTDFECEVYTLSENLRSKPIRYMYAIDGVLNIEIDMEV
jgi:hypothetical protein